MKLRIELHRVVVELCSRHDDGRSILSRFEDPADWIWLESIGCTLALDEVYDKVDCRPKWCGREASRAKRGVTIFDLFQDAEDLCQAPWCFEPRDAQRCKRLGRDSRTQIVEPRKAERLSGARRRV